MSTDTSKKSGFSEFVNAKILPPIMKFVNTKAVKAIQDGMVYSLPFIIIGSIFLIMSNFPIPAVSTALANSGWSAFFSQAYTASFGMISIWSVVGIAYVYIKNEKVEPLPGALTALCAFFLLQFMQVDSPMKAALSKGISNSAGKVVVTGSAVTQNLDKLPSAMKTFILSPVTGVLNTSWMGGQGMVAAIIIGLLVGWSYSVMMKKGWEIKLPEQVPASVSKQFSAMIPAGIILTACMLLFAAFKQFGNTDLLNWIYKMLEIPMQGLSDSWGGAIVIGLAVPFFWFFGVHGGLIVGSVASAFLLPNTAANAALYHAGKLSLANGAHIITNEFYNNFINLTGSGITIGLVVFTVFFAKSQQMKAIGKIELVPSIFNINEPFLFGLPLVMNPFLAVPFFGVPLIVSLSTYALINFGILPPLNGVAAPWTTPAVLSGFFIGGWKIAVWQFCVLVISTLVYFPFAKKYDQELLKREQANAEA